MAEPLAATVPAPEIVPQVRQREPVAAELTERPDKLAHVRFRDVPAFAGKAQRQTVAEQVWQAIRRSPSHPCLRNPRADSGQGGCSACVLSATLSPESLGPEPSSSTIRSVDKEGVDGFSRL